MIIHDTRKVECSECQSADVEHVTYHNSKLSRELQQVLIGTRLDHAVNCPPADMEPARNRGPDYLEVAGFMACLLRKGRQVPF